MIVFLFVCLLAFLKPMVLSVLFVVYCCVWFGLFVCLAFLNVNGNNEQSAVNSSNDQQSTPTPIDIINSSNSHQHSTSAINNK